MPRQSTFEHPESVAAGYSDPEDYNVLFSAKKLSRVVQNRDVSRSYRYADYWYTKPKISNFLH